MKKYKLPVSVILVISLFAGLVFGLSSCSGGPKTPDFYLSVFDGIDDAFITVGHNENLDTYVLVFPDGADRSSVTAHCRKSVTVNGTPLADGAVTDVFAKGDVFAVKVGRDEYTVRVCQSGGLPAVFIRTQSGTMTKINADKEYKESGTFTAVDGGKVVIDSAELKHIKGRGNTSWNEKQQKPYNIKFLEKTDLFGMGAARRWALIAEGFVGWTRNMLGFDLASRMSFAFTPQYKAVDLYLNGDYQGCYIICEKAEVDGERVGIRDLDKEAKELGPGLDFDTLKLKKSGGGKVGDLYAGQYRYYDLPAVPEDITGGYFLEITIFPKDAAFMSPLGRQISIRSPEYPSDSEARYISSLFAEAEEAAAAADGKNGAGRYYTEYFDMQSLADSYLIREFTMDMDSGKGSIFFYKNPGEDKFYFGPVWDFGSSFTMNKVSLGADYADADAVVAAQTIAPELLADGSSDPEYGFTPSLFTDLFRHADFRALVRERWSALYPVFASCADNAETLYKANARSFLCTYFRQGKTDVTDVSAIRAENDSYNGALADFISRRTEALDTAFGEDGAFLFYDSNGGVGGAYDNRIRRVGDTVTLQTANEIDWPSYVKTLNGNMSFTDVQTYVSYLFPADAGLRLAKWNTKPDGSGESYTPGSDYVIKTEGDVLYAIWR